MQCSAGRENSKTALDRANKAILPPYTHTPSPGFVNVGAASLIGIIGSVVCSGSSELMEKWGHHYVDDTLDVFAVHGVGESGAGTGRAVADFTSVCGCF